jgi:hypothetical protein
MGALDTQASFPYTSSHKKSFLVNCSLSIYTGKKVEDIIYVKVHPWKEIWKKGR